MLGKTIGLGGKGRLDTPNRINCKGMNRLFRIILLFSSNFQHGANTPRHGWDMTGKTKKQRRRVIFFFLILSFQPFCFYAFLFSTYVSSVVFVLPCFSPPKLVVSFILSFFFSFFMLWWPDSMVSIIIFFMFMNYMVLKGFFLKCNKSVFTLHRTILKTKKPTSSQWETENTPINMRLIGHTRERVILF